MLKAEEDKWGDSKAAGKGYKTFKSCERELLRSEQGWVAFGGSLWSTLFLGGPVFSVVDLRESFRLRHPRFGMASTGRWVAT